MHIGIDVHGVIDLYPQIFADLSRELMRRKHQISIITGQEWEKVEPVVRRHGIKYDHHFSIVDYHLSIETKMWREEGKEGWWMSSGDWVRSKGDYIKREHVDVHFDDSWRYAEYCPDFCTFVLVPKTNFYDGFFRFLFATGQISS